MTTTTKQQPTQQRYRPTDLETAPAVNGLLERVGLGPLDREQLTAFGGRNDNWAGPTASGDGVFVKTAARLPDGTSPELDRALRFEELARLLPGDSPLRTPELLGADPAEGLTVHRLLPGARSGSELALDGEFGEELCREAGRAVGTLHTLGGKGTGIDTAGIDTSEAPLPPMKWLHALPWSAVQERSMAQIAAWRLVQDDAAVLAALQRLREQERTAPHTPAHCDLRFDQFIRAADGPLHLCDWEEFRLADPARDVGAFAGEWLFHATYSVFAPTGEAADRAPAQDGFGLDHTDIVERGSASLHRHLPRIAAFWDGYRQCRSHDTGLPERAAAFAGWHMFDRLIATAESHATLNPVARAAAGIGRTVLLDPRAAARTLGLAEPAGRSR